MSSSEWPAAEVSILDVSNLAPPEPLERALERAQSLAPGEAFVLVHRREPCLLFPLLEKQGFEYATRMPEEGRVEVLIRRREEPCR